MTQAHHHLVVAAFWDEEARVWVAGSDDVPGLITEASTLEALIAKLRVLIPELLELNQADTVRPVDFDLVTRLSLPTHAGQPR